MLWRAVHPHGSLTESRAIPFVLRADLGAMLDVAGAVEKNAKLLETLLAEHGALLLRNSAVGGLKEFQGVIDSIYGQSLQYRDCTSPRSKISGNIYNSTEYPQEYRIFMHNENSYAHTWPMRILFHCVIQPEEGGETPIADVRQTAGWTGSKPVRAKKVMYVGIWARSG
jgi:hypothetical protein